MPPADYLWIFVPDNKTIHNEKDFTITDALHVLLEYCKCTNRNRTQQYMGIANTISLGSTGSGTADLNQEQDWWKVSIPGDGMLTINFTSTNGNYIWCEVYDNLGTI